MEELLLKVLEEGEWQSLRFTVYNYLEDKEFYQVKLKRIGCDYGYDDLEGKTISCDNMTARQFKRYVENDLQSGTPIIAVCVVDDYNFFTVVKPKNVDIHSILKMN